MASVFFIAITGLYPISYIVIGGEFMTSLCCERRSNCVAFAVIASAFVGVILAILQFTAIITLAPVFSWVVLGVAVAALVILLLVAAFGGCEVRRCVRSVLVALITGIFGAIVSAFIILAVGFAATSVVGAIFVGLMFAFISLVATTTACVIKCVTASCE